MNSPTQTYFQLRINDLTGVTQQLKYKEAKEDKSQNRR